MNPRFFSTYTNTEVTREEAIQSLRDGHNLQVGFRARWEDRYAPQVDVYGRRERARMVLSPEVNWSALGSVSPGEALAYADLITEAARLAGEAI
jgi:hypothetical protein